MKKQSLNHTSIQKLEEYKNSLAQNGNITLVIRIHPGSKNTAWKEMMSD
ncbi:MAG: hypothetical protein U9Q15_04270 [Patescibacteria group bacterium]|nr:hypothetical protein [Patescibacteria group bacterium]